MTSTYIKEIFTSIQGEGLYVGEPQIFIRFCKCNLRCKYCDTNFLKDNKTLEYSVSDLANYILHNEVYTVSLTGGEPLLDEKFLIEFLPLIKPHKKIYLETNGTLTNELSKLIKYVDVVSADIKLQSVTRQENQFEVNDEFLSVAKQKETFIKVVFDENITKDEIDNIIKIAKKYNLPIILQPMMIKNKFSSDIKKLLDVYKIFYSLYQNCRLIPQVHKFMNIL